MTAPDDRTNLSQPEHTPAADAPAHAEGQGRQERPVYVPENEAPAQPAPASSSPGFSLQDRVIEALMTIYDPEIPVNIYEMGLVYGLDVSDDGDVAIRMTLTSPTCPVAESLPPEVESKVGAIEGVRDVKVELTWEPPWTPEKMSEAAKLELGYL
jgi:FeS assembly SUF system protein